MQSFTEVTSLEMPELAIYHELSENQLYHYNEPELGLFIAESPKVIGRALDAGYEPVSFLLEKDQTEKEAAEVLQRCEKFDVPYYVAESTILTGITGYHLTRGVLCAMKRKPLECVSDLMSRTKAKRVAVLENVTNPTNAGAIVRNAAALGMDAILFTSGCTDPLYRRAARVSMGCVFQVPWTVIPQGEEFSSLKELGFKTVAMALRNDTKVIDDPEIKEAEKLAIFLGAEGDGLLPETIAACDYCVKIPMDHRVDSLNVAACSAVAFWEHSKH